MSRKTNTKQAEHHMLPANVPKRSQERFCCFEQTHETNTRLDSAFPDAQEGTSPAPRPPRISSHPGLRSNPTWEQPFLQRSSQWTLTRQAQVTFHLPQRPPKGKMWPEIPPTAKLCSQGKEGEWWSTRKRAREHATSAPNHNRRSWEISCSSKSEANYVQTRKDNPIRRDVQIHFLLSQKMSPQISQVLALLGNTTPEVRVHFSVFPSIRQHSKRTDPFWGATDRQTAHCTGEHVLWKSDLAQAHCSFKSVSKCQVYNFLNSAFLSSFPKR